MKVAAATGNELDFDFREYEQYLEPAKEKGRYICPVCGDDNATMKPDGSILTCWSNDCDRRDMKDVLRDRAGEPPFKPGMGGGSGARKPTKSQKEKDREANMEAARMKCLADEEAIQVAGGLKSKAESEADIAAQCKAEGWNIFAAQQLFREKLSSIMPEKPKPFTQMSLADEIKNRMAEKILYSLEGGGWVVYEAEKSGVWSATEEIKMCAIAQTIAKERMGDDVKTSLINGAVELLRNEVVVQSWKPSTSLIGFKNGILDTSDLSFYPHRPENKLNWALPRRYDRTIENCLPIIDWLCRALGGNITMIDRALAIAYTALTGKFKQKYAELIGESGGGKGTFIRLLIRLVGEENHFAHSLKTLSGGDFAFEGIEDGKRLVTFADELPFIGNISNFLQLTGGDSLPVTRKYKRSVSAPFNGVAIVSGTSAVFPSKDASRGLARRRVAITGWRRVDEFKGKVEERFSEEALTAFTNLLLQCDPKQVEAVLNDAVLTFDEQSEVDPLYAWFRDFILLEPAAKIQVGRDRDNTNQLFGHYYQSLLKGGHKNPMSFGEFSKTLQQLVKEGERLHGWKAYVSKAGGITSFRGIRIRGEHEESLPSSFPAVESASPKPHCPEIGLQSELVGFAKSLVGFDLKPHWVKTLTGQALVGLVGFSFGKTF